MNTKIYRDEQMRHGSLHYLCATMITEIRERQAGLDACSYLHYSIEGLERAVRRLSGALGDDDWFLPHLEAALKGKMDAT
jgi:hypothetical protein